MIAVVGIIVIFCMVFGGYILAGGKMAIIIKSLPFELMMIGGAALGAFLISNDGKGSKHTISDVKKVFSGPKWKADHYESLLCLLFEILRMARQNPVGLEEHIENPIESSIFSRYPSIANDIVAVGIICDTMRSVSMNYDDPHQVEDVLEKRISSLEEHALHSSHALQMMADGLPALGIVAAVLGVIKTMGSIDQPPEVLGKMIGGALVGTFLGVFLAYGLVGPFASRIKIVLEGEAMFYRIIREVLVANLYKHSTNICIEVGRQNIPENLRPSFSSLEDALKLAKQASE
ncbi:flagellar motor stator protein MotA [Poseidonocella sp. HB161398]|uniref:flagellar motor stator protein MotA n=1 Tax=Poseidonocella sp. HB161398 TaxID=2320855 RepID=UPI0011093F83|nr:flagellar motor stator protein MotA [Poseidonocella sp. HB161398]